MHTHNTQYSSGVDDSNSDTDGQCDVVWAKAGRGVWGLCHVFENTTYLTRDLMENGVVPSNLSVPKVPKPDWAATTARQEGPQAQGACSTIPREAGLQQGFLI